MKKRALGFTLLELMFAIAVMGIMAAFAIPNLSDTIKINRVQSRARELYSQLNYARSEAVSRGMAVLLCHSNNTSSTNPTCSGSWSNGWVVCITTGPSGTDCDTTKKPLRVYTDLGQNTLTVVDDAGTPVAQDYFRFLRTGAASSGANFTAKICDSGNNIRYARAIIVTAAGQILSSSQNPTTGIYKDAANGDLVCP